MEASATTVTGGRGWTRVQKMAYGPAGLILVAAWAYAEGIFWPLIAEMPLLLVIVTVALNCPKRAALLIGSSAAASALGVLTNWALVSHGVHVPLPLTTHRMLTTAQAQLAAQPLAAFWHQTVNFIPVKVYASAAGHLHMSLGELLPALAPRLIRILSVGTLGWVIGNLISPLLRPRLGIIQITCLSAVPFVLAFIIWVWS